MKAQTFYITTLFMLLLISACFAQNQILPGAYQEYAKKNTVLLDKEEIILYPDRNHTFEYRQYSDNPGSDKYGTGKYRQTSKKLLLKFDDTNPPRSFVEVLNRTTSGNNLKYQFDVVESQTGDPISDATVLIMDHMKKQIAKTTTDKNGHAMIHLTMSSYPAFFQVESPQYEALRGDLEESSMDLLAYMATKYGEIIAKGKVLKFEILDIKKDRIQLKRDDQEKYFALKEPEY